jgi:hypothetical protein
VNELFAGLLSVPLKSTEAVVAIGVADGAAVTVIVTIMFCPPGKE